MRAGRHVGLARALCAIVVCFMAQTAVAQPYAAMVMDARTGEVIHARNADARLHPASLTKMMTLYVAFEAIAAGEIGLDDRVTVSRKAASEPPSKLGLRAGSQITMRHLIRAAALKSANDAATAIGEAISGSEEAFAARMNRTARAIGMTSTTFRNAHGLTRQGHLSTARDMTIMGRQLFYDHPSYYHLFSRPSAHAGVAEVANTNRRLLSAYRGADGIKTGFTSAAGYNLVASAERGPVRVIATVFGGRSTATRNAHVAELLDMGFARAPQVAALRRPAPPDYVAGGPAQAAAAVLAAAPRGAPVSSPRPRPRDLALPSVDSAPALVAVLAHEIATRRAGAPALAPLVPAPAAAGLARPAPRAPSTARAPAPRPPLAARAPTPEEAAVALAAPGADPAADRAPAAREVVLRPSSDAPRGFEISVGRFGSQYQAERALLLTALSDVESLDGSLRRVVRQSTGYQARFVGLTREDADHACRRIRARGGDCETIDG